MEPLITLATAKVHLRVGDSSHDDEQIQLYLDAAIDIAEDFTNRSLRAEYAELECPRSIIAAILMILGTLYDNESDVVIGRSASKLPLSAEKILTMHRKTPYGDV